MDSPLRIYIRFILYFVVFSIIIALLTSVVNYNNQYNDIKNEVSSHANEVAEVKRSELVQSLKSIENDLYALSVNPLFISYLNTSDTKNLKAAELLFLAVSDANQDYFQVRYLDKDGFEKIRIDKQRNQVDSFIVEQGLLQDKSKRYYFRETKNTPQSKYWYSRLDLNVERGKVEEPIRPTLRVATPVFKDGIFDGILIINAEMTRTLTVLQQSLDFDIHVVDKDGFFILHPDKSQNWGRYLNNYKSLAVYAPEHAESILKNMQYHNTDWHSYSLKRQLNNREDLKMVLKVKRSYVKGLSKENLELAFYLGLLILVVSIPTGILMALSPARLQEKLTESNERNLHNLEIIDEYVVNAETDLEGHFVKVSKALCKISGYEPEELIGKKQSLLKSGEMSEAFYQKMWETISTGAIWRGEIKDKTKEGSSFWLDTTILPRYEGDHMVGYKSVSHDITDQKLLEVASQTDPLTKLFNRLKLDESLEQEILRVNRYDDAFSVVMLDIDFFKSVNDEFGHPVGDYVLCEVSNILKRNSRAVDVVGRWGGEEFMILCLETDISGAADLAEKLRDLIENHKFNHVAELTASFGVAQYDINEKISHFIQRVDDALYQAKQQGRNRVVTDESVMK